MKYRNNKFSEHEVAEMKKLRVGGGTYVDIALKFGTSASYCRYLLDAEAREYSKNRIREYAKKHPLSVAAKKKHDDYMKSDAGRKSIAKAWLRVYLNNKSLCKEDVLDVLGEF